MIAPLVAGLPSQRADRETNSETRNLLLDRALLVDGLTRWPTLDLPFSTSSRPPTLFARLLRARIELR